jgi:opacity protein-like surface antigen
MFKKALFVGFSGALVIGAFVNPVTAADGWYASGNIGVSNFRETDASDTAAGITVSGTAEGDAGLFISGAVGYSWDAFRLEGEISLQKSDLDSVNVTGVTLFGSTFTTDIDLAVDGDVSALGFMVNGWYDFDTGSKWTPYVGGGIGLSKQDIDVTSIAGVSTPYNQDDTVFSYQSGVGLNYNFSENTSAGLGYRYFGSSDAEFDDGTDKVEAEYSSHIVSIGFVHRF